MKDQFSREISYLRISLTDRCNLRCRYCMPELGVKPLRHQDIMSFEEIVSTVKIAKKFGVNKIRLTGGEPLIRKNMVSLCKDISQEGINELCITTNGLLLDEMASDLKKSGVTRINISLDTLDSDKYEYITRGGSLKRFFSGMEKALRLGFRIKINSVLIGGFNTDEVKELVSLTKELPIELRFIELMRLGETMNWSEDRFVKNTFVLETVPMLNYLFTAGTANIYQAEGFAGRIGLISPISTCFCESCNRIRLTSDGRLKPCLHSEEEISVKGLSEKDMERQFEKAVFYKPKKHDLVYGNTSTQRMMNTIGG